MEHTHTVSVLFSRQKDRMSNFLFWVTGRKYTHASIRLDDMGEDFYSFNFKGLRTEHPGLFGEKHTAYSVMYRLEVSDACYHVLHTALGRMLEKREKYRYDTPGLFLCLLHIPHKFPRSYICSQFVAELLKKSGAVLPTHHASVCLPNMLEKELQNAQNTIQTILDPFRSGGHEKRPAFSVLPKRCAV